jgi:hypothetical protein
MIEALRVMTYIKLSLPTRNWDRAKFKALSQLCVARIKTRYQAGVQESGRTQTRRKNIHVGSVAAFVPPTVCFSSRLHPYSFPTGNWDRAKKKALRVLAGTE